VQDGFGWTNAVLIKLLAMYPVVAQPRYEFTGAGCAASVARQKKATPFEVASIHRVRPAPRGAGQTRAHP
jgi:hypothetical protein